MFVGPKFIEKEMRIKKFMSGDEFIMIVEHSIIYIVQIRDCNSLLNPTDPRKSYHSPRDFLLVRAELPDVGGCTSDG